MHFPKCYIVLTACVFVLCSARPISQAPTASTGHSSQDGATTNSFIESLAKPNNDLKLRFKRVELPSSDDEAALKQRDGDDLVGGLFQSADPVLDDARTDHELTTSKTFPSSWPSPTNSPFATITASSNCGPSIWEIESCADPPFRKRRDQGSAFARAVSKLLKTRATVDGAFGSIADYGSTVQALEQGFHHEKRNARSSFGRDAASKSERDIGCRFYDCPESWNATAGIPSEVCRCPFRPTPVGPGDGPL